MFFPHSNRALLRILIVPFFPLSLRFVHRRFPLSFASVSPYFFNLPETVFRLSAIPSALPFRSSYLFPPSALLFLLPARFTRPRSMFARFNFPETPLLPVFTRIAPHRVLSASALHLLCSRTFRGFCSSICAFPTAPFSPLCPPLSLSPSQCRRVLPFALSNHSSLDPLILSIYPFLLFHRVVSYRRFFPASLVVSVVEAPLGASATSRICIYSFFIHRAPRANSLFSTFSATACLHSANMHSLYSHSR